MQRNIQKIIDDTEMKINPDYTLTLHEIRYFLDKLNENRDLLEMITGAFTFGFAMGHRATLSKNGAFKKKKARTIKPQNRGKCKG